MTYYVINNKTGKKVSKWDDVYPAVASARKLSKKNNQVYEVESEYGERLYIRYTNGIEKNYI